MSNGNTSGIRCATCTPEYCGCTDYYAGRLAFWRGEYDAIRLILSRRRIIAALAHRGTTR